MQIGEPDTETKQKILLDLKIKCFRHFLINKIPNKDILEIWRDLNKKKVSYNDDWCAIGVLSHVKKYRANCLWANSKIYGAKYLNTQMALYYDDLYPFTGSESQPDFEKIPNIDIGREDLSIFMHFMKMWYEVLIDAGYTNIVFHPIELHSCNKCVKTFKVTFVGDLDKAAEKWMKLNDILYSMGDSGCGIIYDFSVSETLVDGFVINLDDEFKNPGSFDFNSLELVF